jgi:hypothetical protein
MLAVTLSDLDSAEACQDIEEARKHIDSARDQLRVLLHAADDAAGELNIQAA